MDKMAQKLTDSISVSKKLNDFNDDGSCSRLEKGSGAEKKHRVGME
jgi:hypothetical protein